MALRVRGAAATQTPGARDPPQERAPWPARLGLAFSFPLLLPPGMGDPVLLIWLNASRLMEVVLRGASARLHADADMLSRTTTPPASSFGAHE